MACLALLGLAFFVLDAAFPFPWQALKQPPAVTVLDRQGEPLRVFLPADGRYRQPVALEDVSPLFKQTLMASEDRYFRWHPGVNPLAIARAMFMNLRAGRIISGGSTITMQLARLCEPKERSLKAKCIEAFRALQLEWRLSKDEILEHYINMTPYGGNVVGVAAASRSYFGKDQRQLSLGDAALLTVLPRAPRGYDPVKHPGAAKRARNRLLVVLKNRGLITDAAHLHALAHPLPAALTPLPRLAPHFAEMIKADVEHRLSTDDPERITIASTIDRRLQQNVEQVLRENALLIRHQRLENAAVVVLENDSRALRAMAGSIEYLDAAHHGFINGARIKRSPGSALKPFLYALAMDRGQIVPQSYLYDIPTEIAGYRVNNYDKQYKGLMTAHDALIQSRNVPAVRLLEQTGLMPFWQLLRNTGLDTVDKSPYQYGLPLALGACEVTLLDLASAYATLAAFGNYQRPAMLTRDMELPRPKRRVLSKEAAWLTLEILTNVTRADLPRSWRMARHAPTVAWKTGTSFGHRDAWAVGVSGAYTIGVWVGNLDGSPEMGISGATHAGPLLFDLFRVVEQGGNALAPPADLRLAPISVCEDDHLLPGPHCPAVVQVEGIEGRTRLPKSTVHRRIFVHPATGQRVDSTCLSKLPHQERIISQYPIGYAHWLREHGIMTEAMPPMHPDCPATSDGQGPRILSPDSKTPYAIRPDAPREFQRIALKAMAGPEVQQLYWYQNGKLAASGPPGTPQFLPLEKGRHTLTLVDDLGWTVTMHYRVE